MTKLSVNLNKFALLRNSRGRDYPNVLTMAKRCLDSGVDGITIHPRPDQRHAKYSDVYELAELLRQYPEAELNIEGNPVPEFLNVVKEAVPHQCTLVPDDPNQLTSDHGWDLKKDGNFVSSIVKDLQENQIRVSLFMDPVLDQIELAKGLGTDRIELYTEAYARQFAEGNKEKAVQDYQTAAAKAQELGLGVNAGHDLDLMNLEFFLKIPGVLEVSIGHALVVESFDHGLEETIRQYLKIISRKKDAGTE
ncbi:MAG: pyridoxine 5'-phosphate synthase [SAR324 cluster bacterium]|nr:pyridoxine 5'-phosphate synthase [SAR324 cluster bacterium]